MNQEVTSLKEAIPGLADRIDEVIFYADINGWNLVQVDQKTYMLGFRQGERKHPRINVYLTKSTFVTQIEHPKRGKSQLFRRNVPEKDYPRIFENPRVHTGRGYYRRDQRK